MGLMVSEKAFSGATPIRGGCVANPLFECLHPLSGGARTDLGVGTLPRRVLPGAAALIPGRGAQIFATLRAWDASLARDGCVGPLSPQIPRGDLVESAVGDFVNSQRVRALGVVADTESKVDQHELSFFVKTMPNLPTGAGR